MSNELTNIKFSIIVVSYKKHNELKCLLYSILSQTYQNFEIIVLHDGIDNDHQIMMSEFLKDDRITYIQTHKRYNDWGMTLRNMGLDIVTGDFILNTNDDNYYTPNCLQEIYNVLVSNTECNFVYFDSIDKNFQWQNQHQPPYSLFKPFPKVTHIDMGQFLVRKDLMENRRFKIEYSADGILVEELNPFINPIYIEKVLFIHN
jgi:glycosyltransferase involved in cell wall biosynthesis